MAHTSCVLAFPTSAAPARTAPKVGTLLTIGAGPARYGPEDITSTMATTHAERISAHAHVVAHWFVPAHGRAAPRAGTARLGGHAAPGCESAARRRAENGVRPGVESHQGGDGQGASRRHRLCHRALHGLEDGRFDVRQLSAPREARGLPA